ncbi:hypothetical protein MJ575_22795 [Klebsiella pneumoniae]|nr:hypothetical protein MJ575_22795 [Klebsiella pneumoniae]
MLQGMKARRGGAVEGLFCLQTDCRFLVSRRMLYHNYPLLNLLNGILQAEASLSGFTSGAPRRLQQQTQDPGETEDEGVNRRFLLEPQHNDADGRRLRQQPGGGAVYR